MLGYAVIDTETTGFNARGSDRIAEIAIVGVSLDGDVEWAWSTLINPQRDLGPVHVHGIRAEDVLSAPTFADAAGTIARLLSERIVVAHNASFDLRFIEAEFARVGVTSPIGPDQYLCTQAMSRRILPGSPQQLTHCCETAGIVMRSAHEALSDALASAELLQLFIRGAHVGITPDPPRWPSTLFPGDPTVPVTRGSGRSTQHFLTRLSADDAAHISDESARHYLAAISQVLADRVISARERDQLVTLSATLNLSRSGAERLHRQFLRAITSAAWSDGVLSDEELADLSTIGALLGIDATEVGMIVSEARTTEPSAEVPTQFDIPPGSLIVFTGDGHRSRDDLTQLATSAGLVVHPSVTRKVRVLVAADPDSLSSKARKAEQYQIPIISTEAFEALVSRHR